jgi:hypothetical protein
LLLSDSDDDDPSSIPERSARARTISTISTEDERRIAALKLASEEIQRKLRDAQETLQRRMAEHESELEDSTQRLEEGLGGTRSAAAGGGAVGEGADGVVADGRARGRGGVTGEGVGREAG